MSCANNHISGLLMFVLVCSLLMASATRGDELLRYSQNDPKIKGWLEGVKGTPGDYGVRVAANIVGTWKPLRKEAKKDGQFPENTNVTWRSLRFQTNGIVEISYELAKEGKARQFIGTYQVIHKATEGRGNAPNVVIRSQDPGEENIAVLGVKIGEFNCFPADLAVLWFRDPDGHNYFFEPVGISREEMRKLMGYPSAEEQERDKKTMEDRKLKKRRITDPELTKRIVDNLQGGKLTEEDQNHQIIDLMNKGDATAVPILLEHMKAGHSLVIRQNAIRALGKIGDKQAVSPLLDILRRPIQGKVDDDAEDEAILRRNTVIALGNIGDPTALPVLKTIAESVNEYQSVRDLARITAKKMESK